MTTDLTDLDVFRCRLDGINLVEASAGTGKTWAICGLYLRMILEQRRTVDQILVVTFTHAATAELRDRIRGRIVQTLDLLQTAASAGAAGDPFVRALLARMEGELGIGRETLIKRLVLARECFDEAAIFTIHGYCQRALTATPFAAGLPFEIELVQDDSQLVQQAVNDFWRRHIAYSGYPSAARESAAGCPAGMNAALAGYLIEQRDCPEKFAGLIRRLLGKPLSQQIWPNDPEPGSPPNGSAVKAAFQYARAIWHHEAGEIVSLLLGATDQLYQQTYKSDAIQQGKRDWDAWFRSDQALALYPGGDSKLHLYRSGKLASAEKKNCQVPRHAFFDAAEILCEAVADLQQALRSARLGLLRRLVETVPQDLRRTKRQHRYVAFDDMLFNLHHALVSGEFPALVHALRTRYPVALIDEFQDTDPLQFEIFRMLYQQDTWALGSLFMVGDPKQAIYSFRNADLYAYLGAQRLAARQYTLGANQRSESGLIAACNALFGANARAFLLDGISYHPVIKGERSVPCFRDDSTDRRGALQIWLLPQDAEGLRPTRTEAFEGSEVTVAAEIGRLLREGRSARITIDGRGVQAADIAVLVRSHSHGRRMRLALAARGVGSVELSQASVFRSKEAEEVERILLAIAEPGRERLLRAALATEILGCDGNELDSMLQREAEFYERMQRFAEYRVLWEQHGFPMMFRKLLRQEGVETRLLNLDRGEGRLTNVLHLAELLAAAAQELASADLLLRWLRTRREQRNADDAAQLRLESDCDLVHIVTIHKAKGLEYPIVFCPFLWDGYRSTRSDTPDLLEYHDGVGTPTLDFRPEARDDVGIKALRRDEAAAETLRLIYVALTRAVHRCYLIAGCYRRLPSDQGCAKQSLSSMLNWLAAGDGQNIDRWFDAKIQPEMIERAWRRLAGGSEGDCVVDGLPDLSDVPGFQPAMAPEALTARSAPGPIAETWNRGSFSGMIRDKPLDAGAADHDAETALPASASSDTGPAPEGDDILAFPRGPAAGECLHHLFQHIDFTDPAGWEVAIEQALALHPQGTGTAGPQALRPMLRGMLQDVLSTDLRSGLKLATIAPKYRLSELEFTLPAGGLQPAALNRFLAQHGYPVGRLDFRTVTGYLSGAIDLVFRHGGQYFLLDWKSNHLGDTSQNYARDRLQQAMTQHAYRLQYLLYTVALHRYLERRLPDYDYGSHFGGVFYLFVRGVRPAWWHPDGPAGVCFDRPSEEVVTGLDRLIGGSGAGP